MIFRYIILTVLATLLIVGGGLVYLGYDDNQSKLSDTSTSKSSSTRSSSANDVITASGYNYNIDVASGLGGAVAQLTPITKIVDEKTMLDVIALIPNLNNYKLETITKNNDTWDAKISKDGNEYAISANHYQDNMCPISITKNGERYQGYVFFYS